MELSFSLCPDCLDKYRSLHFDPSSKYFFNYLPVGSIVWPDEHPEKWTQECCLKCKVSICNLTTLRTKLWREGKIPDEYQDFWEQAQRMIPNWPGFNRLSLNEEEMKALTDFLDHKRLVEDQCGSDRNQGGGISELRESRDHNKQPKKKMMKRLIGIIVVLLIGAYFVNTYIENKKKREAEKAEMERIEMATKEAVSQLVKRTNAVDNWEKDLSKGEQFRLEPILTVELEKVWLTDRPILFVGTIKDIVTSDQKNYRIEIERSLFSSFAYMFSTELRLVLQCPKPRVDSFLKEHPDLFKGGGFKNGVAVVADIDKIETTIVSGSKDDKKEIKIGKGKCLDMLYTGDVRF